MMRLLLLLFFILCPISGMAQVHEDHFEKKIRPLFHSKCESCHGAEKAKGKLRLHNAEGFARGGSSGAIVVAGKPEESLLIQAVRQIGELKMPPDGKLTDQQIADLVIWVKSGAKWPEMSRIQTPSSKSIVQAIEPNAPQVRSSLQAWYRADKLPLIDGKPVHVWPDSSGKGRDLSSTSGVRRDGVGTAPQFIAKSHIYGRPAVRFDIQNGLASSPDLPVDIQGDAGLTIILVIHLHRHNAQPPFDGIVGIGNPANPGGDPGRPLAALVQIQRTPNAELQLAGGWNHNATLGAGSFESQFDKPLLLTIVKTPGPMKSTTKFFLNGIPSEDKSINRPVSGKDTVPNIQHRDDIGLYLGKALNWCGSIRGDIGEVLIYNKPLPNEDRIAIEVSLADRYSFLHPALIEQHKASFTPEQKAFWAFQPIKRITPPTGREETWAQTPIDRFISAKLESLTISPASQADKRTLLRRVTFDLIGLPPTPEEFEAFEKDQSPEAFARVVDRLLDSPHYGERWGRHWLDIVRYAETTANDANAVLRYAWRYRDYVVDSLNKDKPYDQFIIEQLAGDLLPPTENRSQYAERIIATGLLMLGPKALAETDKEQSKRDIIDDQIDVVGRAFLGLTISCARCHDHKFDPIPTQDYYSFAGIFRSTDVFRDESRNASMWQEWPLDLGTTDPLIVMAPKEGKPINLRIALRGNYQTPGSLAPRRFLQILAGEGHTPIPTNGSGRLELARWIASKENPLTARVLVNRVWQHHFGIGLVPTSDNFGFRGEKPSHPELLDWLGQEFISQNWSIKKLHRLILLSNVYQLGSRASESARKGDPNNRWYSRSPNRRLDAESIRDAMLAVSGSLDRTLGGNDSGELLFKEGEVIDKNRDFFRPNRVQVNHPIYSKSVRRSIYLPVVRNAIPDVFALFDGADPNGVTTARNDTTVASQALFLLNHPFVREQALVLANRLLADQNKKDRDRIELGYRFALIRTPTPEELNATEAFLTQYTKLALEKGQKPKDARKAAWQSFCQTLLCRNEFLYVD